MSVKITEWKDSSGAIFPRIQAEGKDLTAAFVAAAEGFFDLFTDRSEIAPKERVVIFCESSDSDWLFSDWLNTLLYEIRERGMLFSDFRIEVEGINVKGEVWGEKIDPTRHPLRREVLSGAAFAELYAVEADEKNGVPASVSAVLNDVKRHPLPLRKLWQDASL